MINKFTMLLDSVKSLERDASIHFKQLQYSSTKIQSEIKLEQIFYYILCISGWGRNLKRLYLTKTLDIIILILGLKNRILH